MINIKVAQVTRNILLRPIKQNIVFFCFVFLMLIPRTVYTFLRRPERWCDLEHFPTLIFLSIALFFAFVSAWVISLAKSKVVKYFIYIVVYLLFFINIYLAINFKGSISPNTMLLLLETTPSEIMDFLRTYALTWKSFFAFIFFLAVVATNVKAEKCHVGIINFFYRTPILIRQTAIIILFIFLLTGLFSLRLYTQLFSSNKYEDLNGWNTAGRESMDQVTNLLYCIIDLRLMGKDLESAIAITIGINAEKQILEHPDDSCTVILVIGESFIKEHSSLYGYSLQTNPRMQKEKDAGRLFVFQDAISPSASTSISIRNMLSCNSIGDGEKWNEKPFFPAIFKKAGYDVFLWDNQYRPTTNADFDFSLNAYIHNKTLFSVVYKATQNHLSNYDADLIDNFNNNIFQVGMSKHNLILFHLMGQHFNVEDRYPPDKIFKRFKVDSINRNETWMTMNKRQEIAHYDNCTFYNDSVMSSIIHLFKDWPAVMVYLSDHGEAIYDMGDYKGRRFDYTEKDVNIIKQYHDIPFFVWCSNRYKETHQDIIEALKQAQTKPLMSDNICHVLLRLGGVSSDCYSATKDVLSHEYICPPRIVYERIAYDHLE